MYQKQQLPLDKEIDKLNKHSQFEKINNFRMKMSLLEGLPTTDVVDKLFS